MFARIFRVARGILLVFLLITVGATAALRFCHPPVSAFMVWKYLDNVLHKRGRKAITYEWVDWKKISPLAALAVVASEDQRFTYHWGFDFHEIADAIEEREEGRRIRGASTISQQVAKNLFLWNGKSFIRKGIEAYFTVLMELMWPKRRILEVYLNIAEFGNGIYGVGAASRIFFKKAPVRLTRYESALLAAVLPNPVRYKVTAPTTYIKRRTLAIERQMRNLGDSYLKGL
jgi:monofunctional biosynthetic peptidoglycan transglycosylase